MSKPSDRFIPGHRVCDAVTRQAAEATPTMDALLGRLIPSILLLVVLAAIAFAGESASSVNTQMPPGAMQEKAAEACSTCHEARIIVQQRLAKPAWAKEIDKMIKWGAEVDPKDRDALIEYFAANFGPDQPPYVAPRSATEPKAQSKKTK